MMAERTVSTRLILQGEKEYRAAIADINREMKVLDSQVKLVDSSYQGQRNTMAALEARHKALTDVIAAQSAKLKEEKTALGEAQRLQGEYARQAQEARDKLTTLAKTTDDATKETDEYKESVKTLQAEITKNEGAEENCAVAVQNHTTKANQAQVKLNDLNRELGNNGRYLNEAKASTDGCAKSIDAFGKEVKQTGDAAADMGEQTKAGFTELAGALAAAGITATVKEIAQALMECVDASVEFESAMAGVAKTTNMSGEELAAMGEQFKAMSLEIPITASGLAQIAEAAGQLGITKNNIPAFTEIMAKLGTATDMTSTEAATMLAQFAAVTGMDPSQYSNLGSAIVALGNNFSTTEKKITEMAQTTAGAGANAGMSEPEILALSTAVTSLGIDAATGGTNMSKLIGDMQMAVETGEGLDQWAAAAGMSAAEFSTLWGEDAVGALRAFIVGLGDSDESMLATLSTLDITEGRTVRMITSLANAEKQNGTLSRAITLSNKAWQDNNALNKEAATRFETTESKVTMYKNSVEALKIAVGDQLTPALGALADAGTDINAWAAEYVEQNEWLAPAITGVVVALGTLAAGVVAVTVVVPALKAAWAALSGTFVANPVFLVITALAGLVAGIATYVAATKQSLGELTEASDSLPDKFKSADDAYAMELGEIEGTTSKADALIARLRELETKQNATGLNDSEWREWNAILAVLVETVPELSSVIDLQTGEIEGGTEALIKNTEEWKRNAIEQSKQKALQAKYDAYGAAIEEQTTNMLALTVASKTADDAHAKLRNEMLAYGRAVGMNDEQILSYGDDVGRLSDAITAMGGDGGTAYGALIALADATNMADGEVTKYTTAVDTSNAAVETATQEIDDYSEAYNQLYSAADDAAEGTRTLTEAERDQIATLDEIQSEIARTMKEYDEAYQNVLSGISSTVSGFTKIEDPLKEISSKDSIAALDSQLAFLTKYQSNMQTLQAMADDLGIVLDAGLVAKLSDGSEESAAIVAGMVSDGGDAIRQINEKYGQVSTGKEDFATVMADMQTDFFATNDALVTKLTDTVTKLNQSDAAAAAGQKTIDAFNTKLSAGSSTTASIIAYINQLSASLGSGTALPTRPSFQYSHASGLDRVPYDNYPAVLHKDERVLTALRAKVMDADSELSYNYPNTDAPAPRGGGGAKQGEAIDYDRLGASVAQAMKGVAVNIDGEKAGELLTEPVSRNIADNARTSRYG